MEAPAGGDAPLNRHEAVNDSSRGEHSQSEMQEEQVRRTRAPESWVQKRTRQPVRIDASQLPLRNSDSEDEEPAKKKKKLSFQGPGEGSGFSALLQPIHLTVKGTKWLLLPYAFSKKVSDNSRQHEEPELAEVPGSSSEATTTSSPSATTAAAKSGNKEYKEESDTNTTTLLAEPEKIKEGAEEEAGKVQEHLVDR
ncbi:proline-rich protein PRCC-like isoform X2 [Heteronotia binoei]|uniref:proline-rich protein PRCC-like isoform X2 n=2 Tax=Heteronotia binoei TaxID=13085 RepID=UPI00292EF2BB|nr:proline-rich protein PRCC-like isoform X2 [Heteronotia binoei]XP_060087561.1 proline-rich protein PRCC-like isoform X2 [Heteronotia binoei]